jgi:hypothetical protein
MAQWFLGCFVLGAILGSRFPHRMLALASLALLPAGMNLGSLTGIPDALIAGFGGVFLLQIGYMASVVGLGYLVSERVAVPHLKD